MSWSAFLALVLFLAIVAVSVWLRAAHLRRSQRLAATLAQEPLPSLLSRALVQLVGVAGGIYLGLEMTVSFLKIELPDHMQVFGMGMEPLALFSIMLALVQPFFTRLMPGQRG